MASQGLLAGAGEGKLAVAPNGDVFAAATLDHFGPIVRVRQDTGEQTPIPSTSSSYWIGIVFDALREALWVHDGLEGEIQRIDPDTGTVEDAIGSGGGTPGAVALERDGKVLFFSPGARNSDPDLIIRF